jgi:hypothetical protein
MQKIWDSMEDHRALSDYLRSRMVCSIGDSFAYSYDLLGNEESDAFAVEDKFFDTDRLNTNYLIRGHVFDCIKPEYVDLFNTVLLELDMSNV